ncbi:MAG: tripartite tricarboxylate transporter substrate binding protein [Bradyrhizobium sp.]|uniref:Bug family tripartite tricarboxylate transporter substrate binding protein n=1 Tax=Bradyrhizobium sp. TaxID=376 RepID=UPI0025B8955B|nr:tripartite tricarboxylate transporter substrate binding protein [Bradyrhizobium sp.]MBI5264223.1 tripartite tricarboxylate transporter substrate binding protein [Bradyrhizobium sp.]
MTIWLRMLLISAALMSTSAFAQTYPTRSVTIIAATTPGSLPDVLARRIGLQLSQKWGHPVVIENRPGGAYAIAASAVINAPADGYTLLVSEAGLYTTQPHLVKRRKDYSVSDLLPVTGMASIPLSFVAHPSLGVNSISDLIALAKAKPGEINYGTTGPGTAPHLGVLLLESMAKIKMTAVHYKGVSLASNDLMAGHIPLLAIAPSLAMQAYKAGKVKILGVASTQPIAQLQGVPTVAEAVPGFEMNVSFAVFARAGTPKEVISKINADVQQIIETPDFKKFLEPQALQPMLGSPEQLTRSLAAESGKMEKLIRDVNLSVE